MSNQESPQNYDTISRLNRIMNQEMESKGDLKPSEPIRTDQKNVTTKS